MAKAPSIPSPLKEIYGSDPLAFVMGFFRDFKNGIADIQRRTLSRISATKMTIDDIDPIKAGKQTRTLELTPRPNDTPAELALRVGGVVALGKGLVFADEAQRKARGLAVGPKESRGFDAEGNEVAEDYLMSEEELLAIPYGTMHRNIFGIDDAIILGIGVPLLIALMPIIWPMLQEAASNLLKTIAPPTTTPATGAPVVDPVTGLPVPADGGGILDGSIELPGVGPVEKSTLAMVAAVMLIGIVIVMRKKKA